MQLANAVELAQDIRPRLKNPKPVAHVVHTLANERREVFGIVACESAWKFDPLTG
jgi:hypothetical protein